MSGATLRGLRAHTGGRLAVAALFVLSLAAPRAALLFHQHDGGDAAHEHLDADLHPLAALFGGGHDHDHPHRNLGATPRGAAYAVDHGDAGAHVHHQQRYHAAIATIVAFVTVSAPLTPFVPAGIRPAPAPAARAAAARAPPLLSIG